MINILRVAIIQRRAHKTHHIATSQSATHLLTQKSRKYLQIKELWQKPGQGPASRAARPGLKENLEYFSK